MVKKILLIIVLLILLSAAIWIFATRNKKPVPHWDKPARITPVVNIATDYTFPDSNRQFAVKLTAKKASGGSSFNKQQAIKIYLLRDESKPIFTRDYNADNFNGPDLSYVFATDSASFIQRGSLAVLHCDVSTCKLPWSNFYLWDKQKNEFLIDNVNHKDYFTELNTQYETMIKTIKDKSELTLIQKAESTAKSITEGKNLGSNDIK